MAETIRERIEIPPDGTTDEEALEIEWEAGNLIPRDVHEAGIAAARLMGMAWALEIAEKMANRGMFAAAIRAEIAASLDLDK